MSENEHKIIYYADDATICVRYKSSIKHVLDISDFSKHAGHCWPKTKFTENQRYIVGACKRTRH